ncbi:hypothetical protein HK1_02512 [Tepidibacillus sp. HK-1]|nr:hypothetical protein HK1_02512 [Tepidibacillus sp. HK-1]
MTISLAMILFFIGLIGAFLSGMLGIGGAIVNYPMLLYIPVLIGVGAFTPQEVSAITMLQVLFSSLTASFAYKKSNFINKNLIIIMGSSIIIGGLLGGFGSKYLTGDMINMTYGVLATLAAILMFIPRPVQEEHEPELRYHRILAAISAFIVGVVSGIVGAGGAFILIPIMLFFLKIPLRTTIASSLVIVFLSSIGGTVGKVMSRSILFWPTFWTVIGSLAGAPLGAKVGKKMKAKSLQYVLAILILGTAIKIWLDII